eukprot:285703-Chlamydomonas_euryale.AAC.1
MLFAAAADAPAQQQLDDVELSSHHVHVTRHKNLRTACLPAADKRAGAALERGGQRSCHRRQHVALRLPPRAARF